MVNHRDIVQLFHQKMVMNRRVQVLADRISQLLPSGSTVLDIGAGSGQITNEILSNRPDLEITCIDIKPRADTNIRIEKFDGKKIQYADDSFEYSIIVDVLHHTIHQRELLGEASRVSKRGVIIKDHIYQSALDYKVLSFMDIIGNRPYNVDVIYNYLKMEQWQELFEQEDLTIKTMNTNLGLYSFPLNCVFDRKLHMLVSLEK